MNQSVRQGGVICPLGIDVMNAGNSLLGMQVSVFQKVRNLSARNRATYLLRMQGLVCQGWRNLFVQNPESFLSVLAESNQWECRKQSARDVGIQMVEVQELSDWVGVICLLRLCQDCRSFMLGMYNVHIEICLTGIQESVCNRWGICPLEMQKLSVRYGGICLLGMQESVCQYFRCQGWRNLSARNAGTCLPGMKSV